MIFETHAHYDDEAFDKDRDSLLPSLAKHGIEKIINVGASLRGVADTVRLTEKYPFVYGAVGVHPDEIGSLDEEKMKWLRSLCDLPKVVAVGEIGLDYYWDKEHHDIQKKWFVRQMDLAKETELPIIVHSRDAAKDTLDIMKAERADNLKGLKDVVEYAPLEYLLLETDAPYLAPEPYRRHRNCSAYLTYVAEEIARIKGVSYETVVDVTRENAGKLFGI